MKRRLLTVIAAMAVLPCAFGATPPTPPPAASGPQLGSMIHLVEQRETGKLVPLDFGQSMWKVDINSTIKIQVTPPSSAPGGISPVQTPLSETANAFRTGGQALLKAIPLRAQIDELALANSTLHGQAQAENTQKLIEVNKQFSAVLSMVTSSILSYRELAKTTNDPTLQAHAETFYKNANDILGGSAGRSMEQAAPILSRLIIDEGEFLLAKLNADIAKLAANTTSSALLLAASSSKDNYLPLPHYSTLTPGAPVPFDKLNPLPSPAAVAALQADFDAASGVAQLLNDIKSGKTSARDAIKKILQDNGIDLTQTRNQIEAVGADLGKLKASDAEAALTQIAGAISTALAADPANKAVLQKLQADVSTLQVDVTSFDKTSQGLVTAIQKLDPRFVSASLQQTTDPVAALGILVSDFNLLRNLPNAGAADLRGLSTQVMSAFNTAGAIVTDLENVRKSLASVPEAALKSDVEKALASVPALQQLITDLTALKTSLENVLKAIEEIRSKVGDPNVGAYNPNPPDTSVVVPLNALKDTELNLEEATPQLKEGDVVTLQAWIYSVTAGTDGQFVLGNEVESAVQQFKIVRYGWFADAGAGVTYVISNVKPPGSDSKTQQFAPQVVFLFHDRPWPALPQPANRSDPWFTSWGLGIHAISLDLDRNSQLELGLGVTLSATRGFIQAGFGRDLTIKKNYWYLGTTLFKFLSNLGIKVP